MKTGNDLQQMLRKLDHKSYGMYKSLGGSYQYNGYVLHIDHVQGDPFASPSRMRFEVKRKDHGFPKEYADTKERRLSLEDRVLRMFRGNLNRLEKNISGSGKSGRISICPVGQKVLERIAVRFLENSLEVRFEMGFPARGRTILAREMEKLLTEILPSLVNDSLFYKNWSPKDKSILNASIELADDQQYIREELIRRHLIAFVADGSILPRENGVSDRPMREAVPFSAPEELRVTMNLPHKGAVSGMGIREGVTVIVGGGYHGKSTLLKALEQGVYNHIQGDGREYVITKAEAMKIRAEDGRSVAHTDISIFINHLPNGQNTRDFSTENASGSTSQAANLIESLETGSHVLLMDEDTSATNFMIRDAIMSQLVADEKEPITTLLRHIRNLYEQHGISFVLVVGSSGDYLGAADCVLQMDSYHTSDVTKEAQRIWQENKHFINILENESNNEPDYKLRNQLENDPQNQPKDRIQTNKKETQKIQTRYPIFERKLLPQKADRLKLKAMGTDTVIIDRESIDVRYLEQICDGGQTIGLAYLMGYILRHQKKPEDLIKVVEDLYQKIDREGLSCVTPPNYPSGQPVLPRKQELYACISRYRSAKIINSRS